MTRHPLRRLYKAAVRGAERRDRIEMQSIDRLLSPLVVKDAPLGTGAARALKFRSILCAVDFSEHSRVALRYAEAIAKRSRGHLSVLYVNDPLLVAAAAIALHDRTLAERSGAELGRFVESTLSLNAVTGVPVTCVVTTGTPVNEIAKVAKRRRCDLIVMGAHGITGADKLLIGSTTAGVLRRTAVPVLAIPSRTSGRHHARMPKRSWPGPRIIAAVDLDERSTRDARTAAGLARWFGSAVVLVHVVPEFKAPPWLRARLGPHDRTRIARARSRLNALAARLRQHPKVKTRMLFGDAAGKVGALAATERAGLVITTLRPTRDWLGPRRGSVSYDVLVQANTPVLALPG
jgi:nucleotide-binding universal stress UspA family protein